MFSIRKFSITYLKSTTLQTFLRNSNYSTAKLSAIAESSPLVESSKADSKISSVTQEVLSVKDYKGGNLVAQAFASLHTEYSKDISNNNLSYNDKRINDAKSINELLSVVSDGIITRQHALKIVSVLAQWSTSGKINLKEFETDSRFVKICRVLSRPNNNASNNVNKKVPRPIRGEDLSMVMGVAGDDEAAKLVASLTLPQMVKVMSQLSYKKRRSTPLLRALAYNISRSTEKLDLKQCADIFYSMAFLNFPDSVLLERIGNDIIEVLNINDNRTAVIGSILTSIGLMRYKEPALLDALSEWILKHNTVCRPQDIFSLIITLAVTNYHPENSTNLFKVLIPQLNMSDAPKPTVWLDVVWSLVILNQAKETHILSILNLDFTSKLQASTQGQLTIPAKTKLLNINAAAQHLIPNYKGPLLKDVYKENLDLPLSRTKDKQTMVSAVLDSLASLFPSQTYLRSNVDTKMGFYIDGICIIDKKCNPLPVEEISSSQEQPKNQISVAIMVYEFHDMCQGTPIPHGGFDLAERLLRAQGYKIMTIPYNEFNPRDKVVQRVQYLEKHLKQIASTA